MFICTYLTPSNVNSFGSGLLSFRDISLNNVCLLSKIMNLNGTLLLLPKSAKTFQLDLIPKSTETLPSHYVFEGL